MKKRKSSAYGWVLLLTGLLAAGCSAGLGTAPPAATIPPLNTQTSIANTSTPAATATSEFTATAEPTAAPTATASLVPSPTPTAEPFGCQRPPDEYEPVEINGWQINRRTLRMLEHAALLYGGEIDITGYHITQGSYTPAEPASFGTHDGGGAVDISVMRKETWTVLRDDIEPLIAALRAAGFAAWMREYGELNPDSPYHIHAIAVGDRDLSPAAKQQLTGTFGYFRGFTVYQYQQHPRS